MQCKRKNYHGNMRATHGGLEKPKWANRPKTATSSACGPSMLSVATMYPYEAEWKTASMLTWFKDRTGGYQELMVQN